MPKLTASEIWDLRARYGDVPCDLNEYFVDSDPRLIFAVSKLREALALVDKADDELMALALEEGWTDAGWIGE